jgi:hypothetical protein
MVIAMTARQRSRQSRARSNSQEVEQPERMRVSEARKFLGVSASKITELLSSGLSWEYDPLDRRIKLVRRADLEKLLEWRKQG